MKQSGAFSDQDVQRAIQELQDVTGGEGVNVGVSMILTAIQTAKQDSDPTGRFAEIVGEMCAENAVSGRQY